MTVFPSAATLASKTFADVNGASFTHRAWMAQVGQRLNERFNVKDYGCLGDNSTNDTTNFQAALTAAAGGLCYVPEGTYLVSGLTVPDDTIVKLDQNAILKKRSTSNLIALGNRCAIEGGVIDCNSANFSSGVGIDVNGVVDCWIDRVRLINSAGIVNSIWVRTGSNRTVISRCRTELGVYIQDSLDCQVVHNVMIGAGGLSFVNLSDTFHPVDGGLIEGNYLECTDTTGNVDYYTTIGIFGGATSNVKRFRIANNHFVSNGANQDGCLSVIKTNECAITGNTFYVQAGTVGDVCETASCNAITFSGNQINGNDTGNGVVSHDNSDCVISGNTIQNPDTSSTHAGIHILSDAATGQHRTTITGNSILLQSSTSNANGIFLQANASGAVVEDVQITGNMIKGNNNASTGSTGIAMRIGTGNIDRINITGNTIRSTKEVIEIGGTLTGLMLADNRASDIGHTIHSVSSGSTTDVLDTDNSWNWSTASPSGSESWFRGTTVWNSTPSSGGPPGWTCVTSGFPGTWKAHSNLA